MSKKNEWNRKRLQPSFKASDRELANLREMPTVKQVNRLVALGVDRDLARLMTRSQASREISRRSRR